MFQFRRFPTYAYLIQRTLTEYCSAGFPHSEISGSTPICGSPELIAACHVLRRLLMPRHSPCALSSLTSSAVPFQVPPGPGSQELCRLHRVVASIVVLPYSLKLHNLTLPSLLLALPFWNSLRCSVFKVQSPVSLETRYELSIPIECSYLSSIWWAQVDSNHRPHDYQSCALAS